MKTPSFWITLGIVVVAMFLYFGIRKTEYEPLPIRTVNINGSETFVVWAHDEQNALHTRIIHDSFTIGEFLELQHLRPIRKPTFVRLGDHEEKKTLRAKIEKEIRGKPRRVTLRNLVPIVIAPCDLEVNSPAPEGDSPYFPKLQSKLDQAFADLAYFQDNYGGVAWTEAPNCLASETRKYRELVAAVFYRAKSWWEIW